jgi:large subunit ribosomal protein L23
MGLFNKKKNKEEVKDVKKGEVKEVVKKKAEKKSAPKTAPKASTQKAKKVKKAKNPTKVVVGASVDLSRVLIRPRISEKAAIVADEANAYTFEVDVRATKYLVKAAVQEIYKVTPIKVAITKIQDKKVRVRGQRAKTGVRTGGKKAIVYLKKGDRIEFV